VGEGGGRLRRTVRSGGWVVRRSRLSEGSTSPTPNPMTGRMSTAAVTNPAGARGKGRRVAIAASSFAPHKGGVEELVRQLAHQQVLEGGSPTVFTMRWPKSLPSEEVIEGVPVRRFLYRAPEGRLRHRALASVTKHRTIEAVRAELRRSRADLVHIQCVSSAAYFVEKATRSEGLPLVVTLQGELTMDATGVYERSAFLRATLRELLRSADAVTACSRHTLEEAESWAGIELGDRGSVVYNGVRVADFDDARPVERARPYLFAVGRHVHQKGFDVLLDAFAILAADADFGWDLVVAGDGAEHGTLVAKAGDLGLADRVEFVGSTDRRRTAELFKGCAAFVLPSRHEPFGIVNLEAMAAGKPVVACAVGGVPEFVIGGETGLLVPSEDPGRLAEAILRVHDEPETASAMAGRGRAWADRFDWAAISADYEAVYRQAVSRFRRRASFS